MLIKEGEYLDYNDVLILPHRSELTSRKDVNLSREFNFKYSNLKISGIPIFASNMDTTGLFEVFDVLKKHKMFTVLHKHYSIQQLVDFYNNLDENEEQYVWYSLGMRDDDLDKLKKVQNLTGNKIKYLCLDVPSAYLEKFVDHLKLIRNTYTNAVIMAGNVTTDSMTQQLIISGADIVKCGIGGGSGCLTRRVAGVGMPMLSAIIQCADAAHGLGGRLIADGGIVHPGDLGKAFGANADMVMIGGAFAGHIQNSFEIVDEEKELPAVDENGNYVGKMVKVKTGKKFTKFYGMSSHEAQKKYYGKVETHRSSEGREILIPLKGDLNDTIYHFLGGLASTCSYTGAKDLKSLPKTVTFIKVNNQLNTVYGK